MQQQIQFQKSHWELFWIVIQFGIIIQKKKNVIGK